MNDFKLLIDNITITHEGLQEQAANAVNQALTIRNWLIGYYIVEYEQRGMDRASYGSNLLNNLEKHFENTGVKSMTARRLRDYRALYFCYPQIRQSLTARLVNSSIRQSLTAILTQNNVKEEITEPLEKGKAISGELLITKLSFTHLEQLIRIKEDLKRTFYEVECIKGTWSVRELKRQISSLYFERTGLSEKPNKLSELVHTNKNSHLATDIIKNIYAFEFLDLDVKPLMEESDLETALLNNLQEFIIELGNGFCFEKRQKRILIGENYYFIDLLFYHRILKCHVIVELKIGEFNHGDIGQLNTYLNYYKEEISENNDNAPVGILLVANKDHALVKYATAGMNENLFVQQYLINLPNKEKLESYINEELSKLM